MKRILFLPGFSFLLTSCFSQSVDTVIDRNIYQSYYSFTLKEPLYITYSLYKGGGDCKRTKMRFHADEVTNTATDKDYKGSGYDKGHLANAEDFAYDCTSEELTFRYYNCLPQTVKLNRGIWKKWETTIRKESQDEKLIIITGGVFDGNATIGQQQVAVPSECYKIVLDSATKKILHCLIFKNDNSNEAKEISLPDLKKKLHYALLPEAYWNAD
jgi:endonuclease G